MKVNLSDEEIIKQHVQSSTASCYESLYRRYQKKVYRQCLAITKSPEQAQDFTHDVFIRVFASLDGFQGRSSFATWLTSVVYYYCLDQLKRAKRLATIALDEEIDYYTGSDDSEKTDYQLQQLSNVLSAIRPKDALMLKLKYEEGLPVSQIGMQLNLKESAVKMRLKRSRNRVRELCQTPLYCLY
ncbi:RNA polymerase sigma factor [Spirosoma pulveris]